MQYPFLYASAFVRGVDSIKSSLNAVGKLFMSSHDINFGRVNAPTKTALYRETPEERF